MQSDILAITMGDPAGIGPEVALRSLERPLPHGVVPLLYGSVEIARACQRALGVAPDHTIVCVDSLYDLPRDEHTIGVWETPTPWHGEVIAGALDGRCARIQYEALTQAIAHARADEVMAICTAPWTKEAFRLASMPAVGHTEVLADAFDARDHQYARACTEQCVFFRRLRRR